MRDETLIEVNYYAGGKLLVSVWAPVYPSYRVGESLQLELVPTNRERVRRPAQEWSKRSFVIEEVFHIVRQSRSDENQFYMHLDVMLAEQN